MTIRTKTMTVRFDRAFSVKGTGEWYPAGAYEVLIDEEAIDSMTVVAWRRVAATILVHADGVTQSIQIQPAELDALLRHDTRIGATSSASVQQQRSTS